VGREVFRGYRITTLLLRETYTINRKIMKYEEAKVKSLNVEWETELSDMQFNGDTVDIVPSEPVCYYDNNNDSQSYVPAFYVDKELAEHIVKLHNDSLRETGKE
jgi:hypothetical protein